jgi:hypothetical protein
MYTINLLYQSDIKGIYTKEQETATDFEQLERKRVRMLRKWVKILYPELPFKRIKKQPPFILNGLIQNKIFVLNVNTPGDIERSFNITTEVVIKRSELKAFMKKIERVDQQTLNMFDVLSNYDSE